MVFSVLSWFCFVTVAVMLFVFGDFRAFWVSFGYLGTSVYLGIYVVLVGFGWFWHSRFTLAFGISVYLWLVLWVVDCVCFVCLFRVRFVGAVLVA